MTVEVCMLEAVKALQNEMLILFLANDGDFNVIAGDSNQSRTFKVSSSLLRKRSVVFDKMLSHDFTESQQKSVTLVGVGAKEAEMFLQFLYTGSVALEASVVVGVSALADMYQVPTLIGLCSNWVDTNISAENVATIYKSAVMSSKRSTLVDDCLLFIDANATKVLPHMHVLSDDQISDILSRDSLCIVEQDLIEILLVWAETAKKSNKSVAEFLRLHSNPEVVDSGWVRRLRPRLEKQELRDFEHKASKVQHRAVQTKDVFRALSKEHEEVCKAKKTGSLPYLGFWVSLIPSCPELVKSQDGLATLAKGYRYQLVFEQGSNLVFFVPHRRIRPSSFLVYVANGNDHPEYRVKITASMTGSEWTTLVEDTGKCTPLKKHDSYTGDTCEFACRSYASFKWFKVESLSSMSFFGFDISGVVFSN